MASRAATDERLDGWDAISGYLGWTRRTVIRWEKQKGLPVHRVAGGKRQPVYAYRREIDQWFQKTGGTIPLAASDAAALGSDAASISSAALLPNWRSSRWAVQGTVAAIILLVVVLAAAWRLSTQPTIQITGVTQLTDDGTAKQNLVTDGRQLYFSEEVGDQDVLSAMAAGGGPIRRIPLSLPNPIPQDISSDGESLLILSRAGYEDERSLWIVPTAGGQPYEMAGIKCHSAAWSPNGEWIAFGSGNALYIISRDGSHTRQLARLNGVPETIRWSADGGHLLFFLRHLREDTISLWQANLDSNLNVESAVPLQVTDKKFGPDGALTQAKDGYFTVSIDSTTDFLLHLYPRPWWDGRSLEVSTLNTRFDAITGVAGDVSARRLFILNRAHEQSELVRYDLSKRSFTMMLPGATATYVDLTKNMQMAAYVKPQDGTLWASRADGSDARQLSPMGMDVELPRWSPDGKWIAFMGKRTDRPWRIFIVPETGGVPREASKSDDNQGAPTWSRDGKLLAYGNVLCQEEHTCAVHEINLMSGTVTTLPESQGLATARWSSDGKYIAALNPVQHELYVFDLVRQKWHKLADGINGNDVSWSSDSRYVYIKSSINGQTEILRVAVGGGAVQTVLNLSSFSKALGQLDTWFSLTPDNALLLNRWLNTSEIYALNYQE